MTPAQLAAYFRRIGWTGEARADLPTLRAIHARHCAAIPFENIDVQLGMVPSRDPAAVFAKLVERGRGGWCHEQNTLLGQALGAIGFGVQRLSAGVARPDSGEPSMGSHLALKVMVEDTPWLVDGGFGSWVGAPLPLAQGAWPLVPWPVRLERRAGDARWWLTADLGTFSMTYAFVDEPGDEALMQENCVWQSRDPASPFVQNLVVQRRIGERDWTLRGRVLTETDGVGARQTLIANADALVATLRTVFALDLPEAAGLWPQIVARHAALFPTT